MLFLIKKVYFLIILLLNYVSADWSILYDPSVLYPVIGDIAHGLMTRHMTLVMDEPIADDMATKLTEALDENTVTTTLYKLSGEESMKSLELDIKTHMTSYKKVVYVIIAREKLLEELMNLISEDNLVQRNILYLFLWNKFPPSRIFRRNIIEAMEVCVFVRNKAGKFNFYYNHKNPDGKSKLELVNWWSEKDRLFKHPLLPPTEKVYQNFRGRIFRIPVVHKPPWYFVSYFNDTEIESVSGRDKKLLDLLASKLNFRLDPFDPPDRSQGSAIINNTMKGVLGTIWSREVEIFVGDLTVTYERSQVVDFTFPTLVDNEAFLTHAPGYLNEALALIRPFHWMVWPPVLLTICISGPVMFIIIKVSSLRSKESQVKKLSQNDDCQLLSDCIWVTSAIFLKQSCTLPSEMNKVRLLVIVLYLGATYVIGDMYSANLTSMFARPATETPISTLEQLAEAMERKEMQLLAELHSASHGNLENGTGLYARIWKMMQKQHRYLIETAEMGMQGMQLVKDNKHFALIGGRETFYYNTRRFGPHYFHLSEKLHTRYSAIALQIGCPFLYNFNKILMQLFEAGILTKITEDEYQKLVEEKKLEERTVETVAEGKHAAEEEETDGSQPRPMSMATLSGAFVVLSIGYTASVLLLLVEILSSKIVLPKPKILKLKVDHYNLLKFDKLSNQYGKIKPENSHYDSHTHYIHVN